MVGEGFGEVGLDGGFLICGEGLDFCGEVAEAVVEVDSDGFEGFGVFIDEGFDEGFDGVAEDDGVADLHHGGFQVEGEEDIGGFGFVDLCFEEGGEFGGAEVGGVEDFALEEGEGVFEQGG